MHKTKINDIEIKRTYRPTRIVCDIVSLAMLVVIVVNTLDLMRFSTFAAGIGILPWLFPLAGFGMCAAYVFLTFKSLKFGKYKITKQNAQSVYEWWAFSLSLVKVPLLFALFEGEYMYLSWAEHGKTSFSFLIFAYLLLALIIIRLMSHRFKALTAEKKTAKDNSTVKVKARLAEDNNDKQEKNK